MLWLIYIESERFYRKKEGKKLWKKGRERGVGEERNSNKGRRGGGGGGVVKK